MSSLQSPGPHQPETHQTTLMSLSTCSHIQVVSCPRGLISRWSHVPIVLCPRGLMSTWSHVHVVSCPRGLVSTWSHIHLVTCPVVTFPRALISTLSTKNRAQKLGSILLCIYAAQKPGPSFKSFFS